MIMKRQYALSNQISAREMKEYRQYLGMTQQDFADFIGVSKKTVERWEHPGSVITGPVVLLLRILKEEPGTVSYYEIPPKTKPLRLWYMFRNEVCTLIDVDEKERTVSIRNYTKRLQFRAFGINTEPDYEDYEAFLKERCFPESRDKMKLILEDLNIPFYDPILIIEKTEGRMAEDDFWLKVER